MPNTETSRGKRAKTNLRPVHRHNLRSMVSILSDEDDDSDSNLDIHDNKLDDSTKSVVNLNVSLHCYYIKVIIFTFPMVYPARFFNGGGNWYKCYKNY